MYSDIAIQCALPLKAVFRLPLRATEGLLRSVLGRMGLALPVPDNTTLSRRPQTLRVVIPRYTPGERLHVVVDSTRLKVDGEGEWKVRVHGWGRRHTWRKLHLGVDEASREIVATLVSTANVNDSTAFPSLLEQVEDAVEQVSADGAFDTQRVYDAIAGRGAQAAIPPRENARAVPPRAGEPRSTTAQCDAGGDPDLRTGGVETEERLSSTQPGRKRHLPP